MGVGDVVLRNDLQFERYNLVRRAISIATFASVPGLGAAAGFGTPRAEPAGAAAPGRAHAAGAGERSTAPRPSSSTRSTTRRRSCGRSRRSNALMLAGDGDGLGRRGRGRPARRRRGRAVLRFVRDARGTARRARGRHRARAHRLEPRGRAPVELGARQRRRHRATGREADPRRPRRRAARRVPRRCTTRHDRRWTSKVSRGRPRRATATRSRTRPRTAPARAFDGDVETAWRGGAFGAAIGQKIRVDLDDPITTDHVNLVQPLNGARDRYITKVQLRFDGGAPVDVELDASSRTATGQTISFPPRHFRRLEIEVTGSNDGQPPARGQRERGRVRRGPRR